MARILGKALAKEYGIDAGHVLYRQSGDWYHVLRAFPAALLDANGYLHFESQDEYDTFVDRGRRHGVSQNLDTNTLVVRAGISRQPGYTPFLETLLFSGEEGAGELVSEGARVRISVNAYERSASARRRCIQKWGLECAVCGFNFQTAYGELGDGFIHVHHLLPISTLKAEYKLDPENDLRPVCANCHAMLHRQEPPLTIEALRQHLQQRMGSRLG